MQNPIYVLTHHTIRFDDHDMFMRYRGGGIGHKYMREIEEIYDNMSCERVHHKERTQHTSSPGSTTDAPSKDATNPNGADDDSDNKHEPEAGRDNGLGLGSDSDSDSDYQYVQTESTVQPLKTSSCCSVFINVRSGD